MTDREHINTQVRLMLDSGFDIFTIINKLEVDNTINQKELNDWVEDFNSFRNSKPNRLPRNAVFQNTLNKP